MFPWMTYTVLGVVAALASFALFFFVLTRGTLLVRAAMGRMQHASAHVYPLYSNMRLIRIVDFQPVIAAILLFQYSSLVSVITHGLKRTDLKGKKVLITSCAFGNVMPRVVKAAVSAGVAKVVVTIITSGRWRPAMAKSAVFLTRLAAHRPMAMVISR